MPRPNDSYHARVRRKAGRLGGGIMQVIGGKNRPAPLLAPGVDFITETTPQQNAGERVIDTGHDFVPGVLTRLNGRKYVSENTVKELARLIGWVPGDEARAVQAAFDAFKAEVEGVFEAFKAAGDAAHAAAAKVATDGNKVTPDVAPTAEDLANQTAANAAVADANAAHGAAAAEAAQA